MGIKQVAYDGRESLDLGRGESCTRHAVKRVRWLKGKSLVDSERSTPGTYSHSLAISIILEARSQAD